MRPLRIYADTSVIGGCFDPEFTEPSQRFFDGVREQRLVLVLSDVVINEVAKAPEHVQSVITSLPSDAVERVEISEEVLALRDAYVDAGVLSPRYLNDAAHVAASAVARVDAIVSWNFKHIVRLHKMKAYNQINLLNGYGILTIISPNEVSADEDEISRF